MSAGEADFFTWLGQARKRERRDSEMPGIHGAKGVRTNEPERMLLDLLMTSAHDGHRAVRPEVSVEQLQQSPLVAATRSGGAYQCAGHFYASPGAGDEPDLDVGE